MTPATHRALVQWQHGAGDYWLYVCAAPFIGDAERILQTARPNARPPRSRLIRPLRELLGTIALDEAPAILVDLPPTQTVPAAAILNRLGFLVVPVIQRWVDRPAVLPSERLVNQLVAFGREVRRPCQVRGVVFLLDGDRRGRGQPAGEPREASSRRRAFDNRYIYPTCRFPPASFLRDHGITSVRWLAAGDLAADLRPYVEDLSRTGLLVANGTPGKASSPGEGVLSEQPADSSSVIRPNPSLYRRFVRRAQTACFLADHLVRGEPYLAPDALRLSPADDDLLRRLTLTFARVFDFAARQLAGKTSSLEEMGFPWIAAQLLAAETPRTPLVARFDFVRDERNHWWLLENNADTPSGVREACCVERVWCELFGSASDQGRPSAGLSTALVGAFARATRGLAPGRALGLLTSAGELEDLAQMAFTRELLAETLARQGVPIVLGDVRDLRATRSGLSLRGHQLGAIYRYVPFETTFGTPTFAALYAAVVQGQVSLLNGLFGLLLQHKGLLAWIWAHRDDARFSAEEQAAIAEHLPATWSIQEVAGDEVRPASDVVVKQVFGREGEEVYIGEDLRPEEWDELRRRRTYVVQRRVALATDDALIATSAGLRHATGHATVGSYAVDGTWAGYYTRFGGKIITARAKWLATLRGSRG
jgi:glutathionylspermidine synthase